MAKRRANSEGHIRQRKDGRWIAQIRVTDPLTGLTKRHSLYGKTRTETLDKLRALQYRVHRGDAPRDAKVSVSALMERWLGDVAKPKVKPGVHALYETANRLYLEPVLGPIAISRLRPGAIEHVLTGSGASGSARMRQIALIILKSALRTAVRWGLIARNPADGVNAPRTTERTVNPLTPEQVRTFLDSAKPRRLFPLYVLAIFTGARQGELLALRWKDITPAGIRIRGTLDRDRTVTTPKTPGSVRTVALSAGVYGALAALKATQRPKPLEQAFVFTTGAGKPLFARNVLRDFKDALTAAKLPPFRFQDLRHTYATLSLLAGVPMKVVSEQLGHRSIQITADTYSHVLPAMQSDAAAALDQFFSQATGRGGTKGGIPTLPAPDGRSPKRRKSP